MPHPVLMRLLVVAMRCGRRPRGDDYGIGREGLKPAVDHVVGHHALQTRRAQ